MLKMTTTEFSKNPTYHTSEECSVLKQHKDAVDIDKSHIKELNMKHCSVCISIERKAHKVKCEVCKNNNATRFDRFNRAVCSNCFTVNGNKMGLSKHIHSR